MESREGELRSRRVESLRWSGRHTRKGCSQGLLSLVDSKGLRSTAFSLSFISQPTSVLSRPPTLF